MNRILALLLLVLSFAGAQGLRPQSIIINPNPPADLQVQVWVDKDPSGTGNPVYQFGEYIRISVRVTQDAYVYLFSVRATGEISGILPNSFEQDNFTPAGVVRTFPAPGAQYAFQVDPPAGQDRVLAVASRQPLDISQILDIQSGRGLIQGTDNLARSLSIVVTPLPTQDWVSDEAYYIAGNYTPPPPPPVTGTLVVNSNVSGAQVLINGRAVGNTPINISLNAGTYTLEVRRAGYNLYRASVNIQAGRTTQIFANLTAIVAPPTPLPGGSFTYFCRGGRLSVTYQGNQVRIFYDGANQILTIVRSGPSYLYSNGSLNWEASGNSGTLSRDGQILDTCNR